VPGGTDFKSGTSMAAPHVAGAFAVLRQASPKSSVNDIQRALQKTGVRISRAGVEKPRIRVNNARKNLGAAGS